METQVEISELLKVFSGSEAFWNLFYDDKFKKIYNYDYKDIHKKWFFNCRCSCHNELIEAYKHYLLNPILNSDDEYEFNGKSYYFDEGECCDICYNLRMYTKAYHYFLKIIHECKNHEGYVFINLSMVEHNINMRGGYKHPYISGYEQKFNKEMIILLKEPGENLTMESIGNCFQKVKKTLKEMEKYHFSRRSFYFESCRKVNPIHYQNNYYDLIKKDITKETCDYQISLIGMMQKLKQEFKDRDSYAEYSSRMFYENIIKNNNNSIIYAIDWGS